MLKDRKYDTSNITNYTLEEFFSIYSGIENKNYKFSINRPLDIIVYKDDNQNFPCIVKFCEYDIKQIYKDLQPQDHYLFVLCDDTFKITDKGQYIFDQLNLKRQKDLGVHDLIEDNFEVFHYKKLVRNITHHMYVPKHELLKKNTREWNNTADMLTKSLKINSLRQLPNIYDTDPISRYYNAKQFDLFKITDIIKHLGQI